MEFYDFYTGQDFDSYRFLGAPPSDSGVTFCTFAPAAQHVSIIGDFNGWTDTGMRKIYDGNFWECMIPNAAPGMRYKYRIYKKDGSFLDHADPYAFYSEVRPGTASVICGLSDYHFHDEKWNRSRSASYNKPINIYELHFGSWKKKTDAPDGWYSYQELAALLIPYLKENGYNYLEIMPLAEHPCDESWGYQETGFFSPTSRYGTPDGLKAFISQCHQNGIGVILDFVPVHFAVNDYALWKYDGTSLYEYPSADVGVNEWGSCNFMHSRGEVCSFLQSAACYWLREFHFDGLRMDAVSNLIYWQGRPERGENKSAIRFLQNLNQGLKKRFPHALLIAEDSTAYPGVTAPVSQNGLGFDYKWDLGWMNDTLKYMKLDPVYRQGDHNLLTFSMAYFYSENFILPFSHDEVVHSKGTIIDKIWGNNEQKFAQLKTLYTYMMIHPGKKLNFMGNELGEYKEWDEKVALGWNILKYPIHDSFHKFMIRLNEVYKTYPCMYEQDYGMDGFEWLVVDDRAQSVFAIERKGTDGSSLIAVMNFTGNKHEGYMVPVNQPGSYKEILNSDTDIYTGSNFVNKRAIKAKEGQTLNKEYYIPVNIAPFGSMIFEYKGSK